MNPTSDAPVAAMRPTRSIDRVRGTHDRSHEDVMRTRALLANLDGLAAQHGYRAVDVPVIEHTELFLRKSGGDRVAQLYSFNHRGRDIALRPEFTASIVRLFIEQMQGEPLPVRLSYSGPVFRYEKPQAARSRQFTEFGCELIGASGSLADLEIIALALDALRLAGIDRPRLVLGHIGVVIGFLGGLGVDQRAQDWLTWSMERLRKGDAGAHELPPHLARLEAALDDENDQFAIPDDLDADVVTAILRQAGVDFQAGTRTPDEIVRGLFAKRRRRYDADVLRDAAAFVTRLTSLAGPPDDVLEPLRELVLSRGLDVTPLDELDAIVNLLSALGYDRGDITIDLGMGRGLHYYTGMLFEIYGPNSHGPQLCGGGRYDDLAQVLGARQPVAACGFSLGVERVLAAASRSRIENSLPTILIRAAGDAARAALLARGLRERGWSASLDLRGRNPSATRRTAERQGYAAIAEHTADGLRVIRLADGVERVFDDLPTPTEVRS
jgi:histidyl-tRNA synthetase